MQPSSILLAGVGRDLTSFFSLVYLLIFLPSSIIIYQLVPQKLKKYTLLAESFVFFWLISGKLVVYLMASCATMHYGGLWLNSIQREQRSVLKSTARENKKTVRKRFNTKQDMVVALAVFSLLGTLFTLKYSSFFAVNINTLLTAVNSPFQIAIPSYVMPIGISFFTMQALSYIFDVKRGEIEADTNPVRVALFISFFPQIVEGPICRYEQTARQLWNAKPIAYTNLKLGLQRILFGMVKKVVIADRLNPFVGKIFDGYADYEGGIIAIGAVVYTVQLYMDFSGSMDAVLGTAQIFGITLPENFRQPFFSKSISEFWQRWHITLGTWFKDYVFLPITGAKKMKKMTAKARKKIGNHYGPLIAGSIALLCVWLGNGLWHGAAWSYIFFGMYHFLLILSGNLIRPHTRNLCKKMKINQRHILYQSVQMARVGVLVVVGELFFRASGLKNGLLMFSKMITDFRFTTVNEKLIKSLGMDKYDCIIIAVTLIIVFVVSVLKENGIHIREAVNRKNIIIRWSFAYAILLYIVIFGAYGIEYAAVDPLYAQF